MTIEKYFEECQRTCPNLGDYSTNILHMNMGVNTEIAEAIDPIKKHIVYGKELDEINIGEEIGDANWYLYNKFRFEDNNIKDLLLPTKIIIEPVFCITEIAYQLMDFIGFYNASNLSTADHIKRLYVICLKAGFDYFKLLENNINKLKVRFPDSFTQEKALNRNLEQERIELEK